MRGRKPLPQSRHAQDAPVVRDGLPRCPPHLTQVARREWRRLATPLYEVGVLTLADRAALAAYCQAYARWVEAEERLQETPMLLKTPSGYAQQSPWLTIANKQLELMARYMSELGLTPAARSRVAVSGNGGAGTDMRFVVIYEDEHGKTRKEALPNRHEQDREPERGKVHVIEVDPRI
jgi:P27 family predicted phage terminase small subunit